MIGAKSELYKNITPYAYAANTPVNAVDPDDHLVIFINGFTAFDNLDEVFRSIKELLME